MLAMSMVKEFKEFILKGNMIDMAVGIVIGGAFGAVIKSLVDHVIMPPVGYLMGKVDFSTMSLKLPVDGATPVEIKYGLFINAIISLVIVGLALFMVVKMMNRIRQQFEGVKEAAAPTTKSCGECMMEIPIAAKRCGHCTSPVS
jgi:large conductance mechanosensitive channel